MGFRTRISKRAFCKIDRDDDSCNTAKKVLKSLGFRIKIEDVDGEGEIEGDDDNE